MMGPYITIIKDAFHEARASKIFWVIIGLLTLMLLSLCFFSYNEKLETLFYAKWDLFKIPKDLLPESLQEAVNLLMAYLIGMVILIIALVVTSSFMPNTFAEGSIDLLLSKPVSRAALFIAKFVGGCTFYFLNLAYFILGLFLILGLRFGSWQPKLFLCIFIGLLPFILYYSLSALIGLIGRNAIISVIVTVLFWGGCKIVELANNGLKAQLEGAKIEMIYSVGDNKLVFKEEGFKIWDPKINDWRSLSYPGSTVSVMGQLPIVATNAVYNEVNKSIYVLDGAKNTLLYASEKNEWRFEAIELGEKLAFKISKNIKGEVLIVCADGIHIITPENEIKLKGRFLTGQVGDKMNSFGAGDQYFELNPYNDDFYIFDTKEVSRFSPTTEGYIKVKTVPNTFKQLAFDFQATEKYIYIVEGTVQVSCLDLNLNMMSKSPFINKTSKDIIISNDRVYLLVAESNKLMSASLGSTKFTKEGVSAQGSISALHLTGNEIWLGDGFISLTSYDRDLNKKDALTPKMTSLQTAYTDFSSPISRFAPKPSKIDDVIMYVLAEDGKAGGVDPDEVWDSFWSTLVYSVLFLGLGCFYVARKDF